MKLIVFFTTLMISFTLFAEEVTTILNQKAPPTEKQVEIAIKILQEGLEAKKYGDIETYEAKIKKSQDFLQYRLVKVSYKAQVICGTKVVIKWEDATDCTAYSGSKNLCFKGKVKNAVALFNALIDDGVFIWDTERFENPRIESKSKILLDFKSYEWTDTITIKSCNS